MHKPFPIVIQIYRDNHTRKLPEEPNRMVLEEASIASVLTCFIRLSFYLDV